MEQGFIYVSSFICEHFVIFFFRRNIQTRRNIMCEDIQWRTQRR